MILGSIIVILLHFGSVQVREIFSFHDRKAANSDHHLEDVQSANSALYAYDVDQERDHLNIHVFVNAEARNALSDPGSLWADGKIPYQFSDKYEEGEKKTILEAMEEFKKRTCVRFEPRKEEEAPFILIEPGSGCSATVGKSDKGKVSLGDGCRDKGIVIHELMHSLGFLHEHSRPDRDNFVKINWENVEEKFKNNFKMYSGEEVSDGNITYDYNSIMHYGANNFAKNSSIPTIITLKENVTIGQRDGFSESDIAKINERYGCEKGTSNVGKKPTVAPVTTKTSVNAPAQSISTKATTAGSKEKMPSSSVATSTTMKAIARTTFQKAKSANEKPLLSRLVTAIAKLFAANGKTSPSPTIEPKLATASKKMNSDPYRRRKRHVPYPIFASSEYEAHFPEASAAGFMWPVFSERSEPDGRIEGRGGGGGDLDGFQQRYKDWEIRYQNWMDQYHRWIQEQKSDMEPDPKKPDVDKMLPPQLPIPQKEMVKNDKPEAASVSIVDFLRPTTPKIGGLKATPNKPPCGMKCGKTTEPASSTDSPCTTASMTTPGCMESGKSTASAISISKDPETTVPEIPTTVSIPVTVNTEEKAPGLTTSGSTSIKTESPSRITLFTSTALGGETSPSRDPDTAIPDLSTAVAVSETVNTEEKDPDLKTPDSTSRTSLPESTALEGETSESRDPGTTVSKISTTDTASESVNTEEMDPDLTTPGSARRTNSPEITTLEGETSASRDPGTAIPELSTTSAVSETVNTEGMAPEITTGSTNAETESPEITTLERDVSGRSDSGISTSEGTSAPGLSEGTTEGIDCATNALEKMISTSATSQVTTVRCVASTTDIMNPNSISSIITPESEISTSGDSETTSFELPTTDTTPETANTEEKDPELATLRSTSPKINSPESTTLESEASPSQDPDRTATELPTTGAALETLNTEEKDPDLMTPGSTSQATSPQSTTLEGETSASRDPSTDVFELSTTDAALETVNTEEKDPDLTTSGSTSQTTLPESTTLESETSESRDPGTAVPELSTTSTASETVNTEEKDPDLTTPDSTSRTSLPESTALECETSESRDPGTTVSKISTTDAALESVNTEEMNPDLMTPGSACRTTSPEITTLKGETSASLDPGTAVPELSTRGATSETANTEGKAPEITTAGSTNAETELPEITTLVREVSGSSDFLTSEDVSLSVSSKCTTKGIDCETNTEQMVSRSATSKVTTAGSETTTPGSASSNVISSIITPQRAILTSRNPGITSSELPTTSSTPEIVNTEEKDPELTTLGITSSQANLPEITTLESETSASQDPGIAVPELPTAGASPETVNTEERNPDITTPGSSSKTEGTASEIEISTSRDTETISPKLPTTDATSETVNTEEKDPGEVATPGNMSPKTNSPKSTILESNTFPSRDPDTTAPEMPATGTATETVNAEEKDPDLTTLEITSSEVALSERTTLEREVPGSNDPRISTSAGSSPSGISTENGSSEGTSNILAQIVLTSATAAISLSPFSSPSSGIVSNSVTSDVIAPTFTTENSISPETELPVEETSENLISITSNFDSTFPDSTTSDALAPKITTEDIMESSGPTTLGSLISTAHAPCATTLKSDPTENLSTSEVPCGGKCEESTTQVPVSVTPQAVSSDPLSTIGSEKEASESSDPTIKDPGCMVSGTDAPGGTTPGQGTSEMEAPKLTTSSDLTTPAVTTSKCLKDLLVKGRKTHDTDDDSLETSDLEQRAKQARPGYVNTEGERGKTMTGIMMGEADSTTDQGAEADSTTVQGAEADSTVATTPCSSVESDSTVDTTPCSSTKADSTEATTDVSDTTLPFELSVQSGEHSTPYHKVFMYREDVEGRTALSNPKRLWKNGVVPYEFSNKYNEKQKGFLLEGMEEFKNKTCVRFVKRKNETSYIFIEPETKCQSEVGRQPGSSTLTLSEGCYLPGTIVHEYMHVLGFVHEHNRPDRDSFVMVVWDNIIEDAKGNFKKHTKKEVTTLDVGYDYDSVMHYGAYEFAKDSDKPTLVPLQSGVKIGDKDGFSKKDLEKINKLYDCPAKRKASDAVKQKKEKRDGGTEDVAESAQKMLQNLLKFFEMNFQRLFRSILRTIQKFRPIVLNNKPKGE